MKKIFIICGPTASGKTDIGIEIARELGGEIISADSQQVWRGFDIGTAKVNISECGVKHHLLDVVEPDEHFDSARFVGLADNAVEDIYSRGGLPIVVGGTGMYIRMLEMGICDVPPRDDEYRDELSRVIFDGGLLKLYEELKSIDSETAASIHPNDKTRISRALEIYRVTGKKPSQIRNEHAFSKRRYETFKIAPLVDRKILYDRINARVDDMIKKGLVDEVRELLKKYDKKCQPFSAVGYKEFVSYIAENISLDDAILATKKNSRHLAKRQLTWFRADDDVLWVDLSNNVVPLIQHAKSFFGI